MRLYIIAIAIGLLLGLFTFLGASQYQPPAGERMAPANEVRFIDGFGEDLWLIWKTEKGATFAVRWKSVVSMESIFDGESTMTVGGRGLRSGITNEQIRNAWKEYQIHKLNSMYPAGDEKGS